jgi:hypothetical protein
VLRSFSLGWAFGRAVFAADPDPRDLIGLAEPRRKN